MRQHPMLAALLVALCVQGCASTPAERTPKALFADDQAFDRLLDMEPIVLEAAPDGYLKWQSEELFEAGNDAYDEAEWTRALAYYDRLTRKFAESDLVPAAIFNAGLAAQHLDENQRAEAYFQALLSRYQANELATSALWNLVELYEARAAWREVLNAISAFERYDLQPDDAFELDARAWIARTVLKPTDTNVEQLREVADQYNRRIRNGGSMGRETLARTYWTIGEVYLGRSQSVIVDPDSKKLEADLELKAQHLLQAQESYMQTVRALEPTWATAAVYRIGFAYESFYADLVSAPAPQDLRSGEQAIYFAEVRKALGPVKRKAELAYQRIIRFSKQYGLETDWVRRAEDRLSRLQRLKLPENGASQG